MNRGDLHALPARAVVNERPNCIRVLAPLVRLLAHLQSISLHTFSELCKASTLRTLPVRRFSVSFALVSISCARILTGELGLELFSSLLLYERLLGRFGGFLQTPRTAVRDGASCTTKECADRGVEEAMATKTKTISNSFRALLASFYAG